MTGINQLSPLQLKGIFIIAIATVIGIGAGFAVVEYRTAQQRLILATTTSTQDSGLLDYLIPAFEEMWGVDVQVIAVGTGQALTLGKSGDCDAVLVHARSLEDAFVSEGYGVHRVTVWYNDFVIVGPADDPANISGLQNATEAFIRIHRSATEGDCTFYSRGDGSGTWAKEVMIWELTGLGVPSNQTWYKRTGQGMGATLTITNNDPAGYTLTDRGTYISLVEVLETLKILAQKDKILLNPYGAILVNPSKYPSINFQLAVKFIAYLCSPATQAAVNDYQRNGLAMFYACYGESNSTELGFDTPAQVEDYLNYWDPLIQAYYP